MTILPTRIVEKPWGRDRLPAPFAAPAGKRIGEIWFEPPETLPELLAKYLFTSEKLSVQVHPDDDQAEAAGYGRSGKEECWFVLAADPGAQLGIGFRHALSAQDMRDAALDGSIEDLLAWHEVAAGDVFSIPAGTVHAIGAGVTVIEVQQNSDITYRLFDYGRPRELHLDAAIPVADGGAFDPSLRSRLDPQESGRVLENRYFTLDQVADGNWPGKLHSGAGPALVLPYRGDAQVDGIAVQSGQCAVARQLADVEVPKGSSVLIARPKRK
ncbi:class I mannose-6-phosphate isomerase [Paraurantiacibacter namhicola]|uniref:Putative mannose-6-phosphate isomerase GmuF n=1 Tax=Paraurantiacibacter namhicola TaxID=645517 RepID=A0A1C7D540_9SPHN|nr:class I mannose-6-phosphate isomerase [Paraurantiacibacter namhicola]ANU06423.1 putative mannose-6-phosphate isomerase GmuF [Paraurantiacibacter namhicola]